MSEKGLRATSSTFDCVITGAVQCGKINEALQLMEQSHEQNNLCDGYSYYAIIIELGKRKNEWKKALQLLDEIEERLSQQHQQQHQQQYHQQQKQSRKLTGITRELLEAVIRVCVANADMKLAKGYMKRLKRSGFSYTTATYRLIMFGFGKQGKWRRTVRMLRRAKREGVCVCVCVYCCVAQL